MGEFINFQSCRKAVVQPVFLNLDLFFNKFTHFSFPFSFAGDLLTFVPFKFIRNLNNEGALNHLTGRLYPSKLSNCLAANIYFYMIYIF